MSDVQRISVDQYDMHLSEIGAEFVRQHGRKLLFYVRDQDRWLVAEREGQGTVRLETFQSEEDCGC